MAHRLLSPSSLHPSSPSRRRLRCSSASAFSPSLLLPDSRFSGPAKRASSVGYLRTSSSCLVVPPPPGRRPLAVVKFVGGAFIGAVPEVTYSYLTELLAREGYLVVSVPYGVTFEHEAAARAVYERFHACFDALLASGIPEAGLSPDDLARLPLYSVGHSNGALLQLLVGSYYAERIPKANAVVSFNNKSASEAVPYFEQIGPLFRQVKPTLESSPLLSLLRSAYGGGWQALFDTAGTIIQEYDREAYTSVTKFIDQLPSVFNQVSEGTSEFRPAPLENREFFRNSYNVSHTLLVKFVTDPIDETDVLEDALAPRIVSIGGQLKKVELSGNHLTPCLQDLKWQAGQCYTPADAIAQSVKSLALNETKVLSRAIIDWFQSLDGE